MNVAEAKSLRDKTIGENITRLRGNLSQQALADLMRERGHDWTQATVWSVEKGRRPIRLAEAEVLAEIMRVELPSLLELPNWIAFHSAVSEVSRAEEDLRDAGERFEKSLHSVAYYADLLIEEGVPRKDVQEVLWTIETFKLEETAVDFLRRRLLKRIPGEASGEYMRRYLNSGGDDGERQAEG